jgi:hypothetical protein
MIASKLWIAAGILLLGFVTGWQVNGWRYDSRDAAELKAAIETRDTAEKSALAVAAELEAAQAALRTKNRENSRKAYLNANNPDRSCPVPASVLLEHNAAAMGYNTSR